VVGEVLLLLLAHLVILHVRDVFVTGFVVTLLLISGLVVEFEQRQVLVLQRRLVQDVRYRNELLVLSWTRFFSVLDEGTRSWRGVNDAKQVFIFVLFIGRDIQI
jgi:hypothetical protein